MAQPVSSQHEMSSALGAPRSAASAIVMGGAVLGVVLLLGALVLWFHYGTAVFFETIASGISGCFSFASREFHDGSDRAPVGQSRGIRWAPVGRVGADAVGAGRTEKCDRPRRDRRVVSADRPE